MNNKLIYKLIQECYEEVIKEETPESITNKIRSTALTQMTDCLEFYQKSTTDVDKVKYLNRIIKSAEAIKKTYGMVSEDAPINNEIGSFRRVLISNPNRDILLPKIEAFLNDPQKKTDFSSVEIKIIKSPVKPELIVVDLNGPKAHILSIKLKDVLKKDPNTKVIIRDDVKLKPKQ